MKTQNPSGKPLKEISVVGGAGHVGLPLSLAIAKKGLKVNIIDIDENKLEIIKSGKLPFMEEGGNKLISQIQNMPISFSSNYNPIKKSDTIILTVGTPIDEHLNPDLSDVFDAIEMIKPFLKSGQLLILRSTLFPGTSNIIKELLEDMDINVDISFCPERIAQGQGLKEIFEIPQIISGSSQSAIDRASCLFSLITKDIIILNLEEAEVAKLFSNAWRYLKFSIANQFYTICLEKGLDFEKIRNAMMHNYARAKDFPKSGFAAGPCLFKDTMQLAAYSRHSFTLGHNAMLVNEMLPEILVDNLKKNYEIRGANIGILGMAFKPNNDDKRESLAYKLLRILKYEGAKIFCTDPYILDERFYKLEEVLENCKILFIGCAHDEYKNLNLDDSYKTIDCWGML